MGLVLHASGMLLVGKADLDAFQPFGPAGGPAHRPVVHIPLPAITLYVGRIPDQGTPVGAGRAPRSCLAFLTQDDLDPLQTLCLAGRPGRFPVLGPAQPSVALGMDVVIDIIFLRHLPGETDLDGLQTFGLALRPAHGPVVPKLLPADALHMSLIDDRGVSLHLKAGLRPLYRKLCNTYCRYAYCN